MYKLKILFFLLLILINIFIINLFFLINLNLMGIGDWGLGIGEKHEIIAIFNGFGKNEKN